jgi:hypothetical protein
LQFDPNRAVANSLKGKFIASLNVSEATSKAGNQMLKVELTINANGRDRKAWDYIGDWNLYKLKELAEVCNLLDKFNTGVVSQDDLDGQVVGVVCAPDKDDEDKIAIKHYITRNEVQDVAYVPSVVPGGGAALDDDSDIPFAPIVI